MSALTITLFACTVLTAVQSVAGMWWLKRYCGIPYERMHVTRRWCPIIVGLAAVLTIVSAISDFTA